MSGSETMEVRSPEVGPGGPRRRSKTVVLAIGLFVAGMLAALAILQSVSVHMSQVTIVDPDEPEFPDDFDCISLSGETDAHYLHITMTVSGSIQAGCYSGLIPICKYEVGVWVKEPGEDPYVYSLRYIEGQEQNYGVETDVDGDKLMFEFPLSSVEPGAYIITLSGHVFSESGRDDVYEAPVEEIEIQKLVTLPVSSVVLIICAALIAAASILVFASPLRLRKDTP